MEWNTESTPFMYPCFVVWRNLPDGTRKGRVVVDIRALNSITVPDAYPVPSQTEILAELRGATYISTVDCAAFFHQWSVKPEHQHRLTVASHRGQERFNVAVMSYKNSVAYVQRRINTLLWSHRGYARAYVDDIVIFSKSLNEHVAHLQAVFTTLTERRIILFPKQSFIGYPSIRLLGQKVDALGLATDKEKLAAIANLDFPRTLRSLETYLGLTGYLRQYIPMYAQVVKPLQERKTALNRGMATEAKGNARKAGAIRARIDQPTRAELQAFYQLQSLFSRPTMLCHFDPKKQLFVDLDASKAFGFGAVAYHGKRTDDGGTGAAPRNSTRRQQPAATAGTHNVAAKKKLSPTAKPRYRRGRPRCSLSFS